MIKAYAKVNLGLRVIDKLDNGYHKLEMINYKINLYDKIHIFKTSKTRIIYDKLKINPEEDVILRMIKDLQHRYSFIPNLTIYIKKRIPIAAGLGGMSSDIAAILIYLNKKYKLGLSIKEMSDFVLNYGTDICFCLHDKPCLVTNIGDVVEEIELDLPKKVILFYPIVKINTKDIYAKVKHHSNSLYNNNLAELNWLQLQTFIHNDLEDVINDSKEYLEISNLIKELRKSTNSIVNMSGSGSSIIIYNDSKKMVKRLKKTYPRYLIGRFKVKE